MTGKFWLWRRHYGGQTPGTSVENNACLLKYQHQLHVSVHIKTLTPAVQFLCAFA